MKNWFRCAFIRAIKTMCQSAIAILSASKFINEVHWLSLVSAVLLSGVLSILTSIVSGLPEVDINETKG